MEGCNRAKRHEGTYYRRLQAYYDDYRLLRRPFRCPILGSLQSFDRRHWLRSIRADRDYVRIVADLPSG